MYNYRACCALYLKYLRTSPDMTHSYNIHQSDSEIFAKLARLAANDLFWTSGFKDRIASFGVRRCVNRISFRYLADPFTRLAVCFLRNCSRIPEKRRWEDSVDRGRLLETPELVASLPTKGGRKDREGREGREGGRRKAKGDEAVRFFASDSRRTFDAL